MTEEGSLMDMTAAIVSAYVQNNTVAVEQLPGIIRQVYRALQEASTRAPEKTIPVPAVPISKSITPDFLVCLEDGRRVKMLKRHLRTKYGLSPQAYRAKWGLPADYPMVAPNYALIRSALAKGIGLGQKQGAGAVRRS